MAKKLLVLCCLMSSLVASAITYTYGDFDKSKKTCTLIGWGGNQPTSGKLTLKETYESDGVTYKITRIAAHALDNLTTVTEITIPANVTCIGEAYVGTDGEGTPYASCQNFFNCPALTKFKVADGNVSFAASNAGLLMYKGGGSTVVRVPQALAVTGGRFNMSNGVKGICPDAFAGNSTISTLGLSTGIMSFFSDPGFSQMKSLSAFAVNGTDMQYGFVVANGVLYGKGQESIISMPPCYGSMSFTVPASVKKIGQGAFRNTLGLYQVHLGKVTEIGENAFIGSGLTSVTIPSTVTAIGANAFWGCSRLASIVFQGCVDIPANFARECPKLASVEVHSGTKQVGQSAFKGCGSLKTFNFCGDTEFSNDSIFSMCGFNEVVFQPGAVTDGSFSFGIATFDHNAELELLDLSGLELNGKGCYIPEFFVSECPKLHTVIFPEYTAFSAVASATAPMFGYYSDVKEIRLGAFLVMEDCPAIVYNYGNHTPDVYLLTTGSSVKSWPLCEFFGVYGGAVCKPQVYCEAYTLTETYCEDEYVFDQASYHIPGGTAVNYQAAVARGCQVTQMYEYLTEKQSGNLRLKLLPQIDGLSFSKVTVNKTTDVGLPDANGYISTGISCDEVENITVEYTLNGVEMTTFYPEVSFTSGVESVASDCDSAAGIRVAGRTTYFGGQVAYEVTDLTGKLVLSGVSSEADLSILPSGVYVISAIRGDGSRVAAKARLH